VLVVARRYILVMILQQIVGKDKRNLPARNTPVKLLALYTKPESQTGAAFGGGERGPRLGPRT